MSKEARKFLDIHEFSFTLQDDILDVVASVCQAYADAHLKRRLTTYKNPYNKDEDYILWAIVENTLDDLKRNNQRNNGS